MMLAAGLVVVAALAGAAPEQPVAQRPSRPPQTDQTLDVSRGARLTLDNFAGEVAVRTWTRDAVRITARHGSAKVDVQKTGTGISVRSTSSSRGSVDYEITVPTWMPLRLQGTYNFITVEGAQSEVHAETTKGDVIIKGGSGAVTAKSIQGRVVIEGARGRVTASSVNEGVRIVDASGDISAESTNGSITMMQVKSENVEVSTVNGNISFEGPPAPRGRYRFTTHNGNIVIVVPDNASATLFVRTYNGSFGSALPVKGPPRDEARQGRRNTYVIGDGSAEMELESFGGHIRIRRPGGDEKTSTPKKK